MYWWGIAWAAGQAARFMPPAMEDRLGRATVAQRLNVPVVVLEDWIDGYPPVPDWKVTALVELVDAGINGQASA